MRSISKKYWTLFLLSLTSAILVLPYALTLQKDLLLEVSVSLPVIVLVSIIQSAVIFAIAVYVGSILSEKIGFQLPWLSAWFDKKKIDYRQTLQISIISGIAVGIVIIILDRFVFKGIAPSILPPVWQGFLASFYGGIGEEMLMRYFLLSLIIFIIIKITGQKNPNAYIVWPAIVFVAVIFGLGHLPATSSFTPITTIVIIRAIVLNGIGGVVFGWLYWKKGLESAIISHFCADIVLHVVSPLIGI